MDAISFLSKFDDKSVDLVLVDPPYDFPKSLQEQIQFEFYRVCRGAIIVFCPPENQWHYNPDQYLFWFKPISTKNTSKSYSRFVEMILVWGRSEWITGRHWSQYTNVFQDLVDDSKLHKYRKPPSLIERLILNHTKEEDIVLDTFMGSGVVKDVCKRNNRNFVGTDIAHE